MHETAANRAVDVRQSTPGISEAEHEWCIEAFEEAEELGHVSRQLSERDADYYHNHQLTAEQTETLQKRGQPTNVFNRVGPKIDFLIGLELQQRTDPKAYPRNPNDEDAAEAATDALRYVADKEQLDQVFSTAWDNMLLGGFCTAEVNIKEGRRGTEIWVTNHAWDYSGADPHSRNHDYSDARFKFVVKWMDHDDAIMQWPSAEDAIEGIYTDEYEWDFEDKPHWQLWSTRGSRKRIRVVQMCFKQRSQWKWIIFSKGVVFAGGDVPFEDHEGDSECPLLMMSAYVDRDNNRYGAVRRLIGPQNEINARRAKLLHMMHNTKTWGTSVAVDDVDDVKRELNKPDGHIEINGEFGKDFGFLDQGLQMQGQAELLQESKNEIDNIGANNALQGKGGDTASGRAIQASQQGGMVEISVLTDRHRQFKNMVYRAIWNRIRQYWDEERWVRVTDDEDKVKFVGMNRTLTKAEKLIEDAEKDGMSREEAEQRLQQAIQQDPDIVQDLLTQVRVNVAADMDMDINVEEVPDVVSIQQEQFDELSKLLQSGIPLEDPRMKMLISASSLRDKSKLLEQIDGQKAPSPEQQKQMELQQKAANAQVEGVILDNEKKKAEIATMGQGNEPEPVDPERDALEKAKLRADIGNTNAKSIHELAKADAADDILGNLLEQHQQNSQAAGAQQSAA